MSTEDHFDDLNEEASADEDREIEGALLEYADLLDERERDSFLSRLRDDPSFFSSMSKSLSEMAMLIAGAAVIDEREFNEMRKRIMFEARQDTPEIRTMRLYYINNHDGEALDRIMEGEAERKRFAARLKSLLADYAEKEAEDIGSVSAPGKPGEKRETL